MELHRLPVAAALAAAGIALSSCGGGGGGGAASTPPVPPPTPASSLSASPSTLSFTAAQQTLTVTVSESGYQGGFALESTCTNIAALGKVGNGPQTAFSVTSLAAGTCSVSVIDGAGQKSTVGVTVTTGSGAVQ